MHKAMSAIRDIINSKPIAQDENINNTNFRLELTFHEYSNDPSPVMTEKVITAECNVQATANGGGRNDGEEQWFEIRTAYVINDTCTNPDGSKADLFPSDQGGPDVVGKSKQPGASFIGNSTFIGTSTTFSELITGGQIPGANSVGLPETQAPLLAVSTANGNACRLTRTSRRALAGYKNGETPLESPLTDFLNRPGNETASFLRTPTSPKSSALLNSVGC